MAEPEKQEDKTPSEVIIYNNGELIAINIRRLNSKEYERIELKKTIPEEHFSSKCEAPCGKTTGHLEII
jgi:hypothetical protein